MNRYSELMENGETLNPTLGGYWQNASYPGEQSGFFLAHPGNDSILYFISLDFGYHPRGKWPYLYTGSQVLATTIDLNAKGGKGKVTKKYEVLVAGNLMSAAAVRHANGRDWWLLTPDADSNRYYRVLLSPAGFSKAEVQLIGSKPDNIAMGRGNQVVGNCFSPSGRYYIDRNDFIGFSIFDFDRCTGLLSSERRLNYPPPAPPNYMLRYDSGTGVVFSPDDHLLYTTLSWANTGGPAPMGYKPYLLQYDLSATDIAAVVDTLNFVDNYAYWPYVKGINNQYFIGAEMGPDGRIYIVHRGDSYCTVQYPNVRGKGCKFKYDEPDFHNVISRAIPYMPNYRLGPLDGSPCDTLGINNVPVAHFRIDDSLNLFSRYFYDLSYHEPAEWLWDFGDGTTSKDTSALHTYDKMGVYKVCLTVKNANGVSTHCRAVRIYLPVLGASEGEIDGEQVFLSPNPASDHLKAVFAGGDYRSWSVFSAQGSCIRSGLLAESAHELDLSVGTLPSGVYTLCLQSPRQSPVNRVFVVTK